MSFEQLIVLLSYFFAFYDSEWIYIDLYSTEVQTFEAKEINPMHSEYL